MTATAVRDVVSGSVGDLVVSAPARRRRPEVLVGALLIVGGALVAVLVFVSSSSREAVLAAARPIERGEVITADAVRIVYVSSDAAIAHVKRSDARLVVGERAASDVPRGALLTEASARSASVLGADEAAVALAVEVGGAPPGIAVGDRVDVVASSASTDAGVVVADAEVLEVEVSATDGRLVVSLRTSRDAAAEVAAFPAGALRLVVIGE